MKLHDDSLYFNVCGVCHFDIDGNLLLLTFGGVFHFNVIGALQVDILCNEEILGKDHTLKFVFVTRWRTKVS